ncbi:MAG: choice-of-anchor L domain-containing protein [Flavobacteriales bacterium]
MFWTLLNLLERAIISIRVLLLACSALIATVTNAQLTVNSQTDLRRLAESITGPGVVIANPQITCHAKGYGQFHYTGSLLGVNEGVILTSGRITDAIGPNDAENTSFQQGTDGDNILNKVTGRKTNDACKFEFDIIPAGDSLKFDFVFASEEYNEWVGSQYNDVFGFFISGPGISGDAGIGNDHNIALVPNTSQAVTINNVNNGSNSIYYHDNAGGQHIQYDGFTVGLSARSRVTPCNTYHLKLIVADASDRKYDSGVFIDKVQSNPVKMTSFTASGGPDLIEGCNNGWVRFTRQTVTPLPLTLQYYLQGTATNGVDYATIGDPSPLVPKTIVIPANEAYADQPVTAFADAIAEGTEYLRFILGNPNCPGSTLDSLDFAILDTLNASFPPTTSTICRGDSVHFQVNGGQVWNWTPPAGLSDPTSASPWARPTATTTYTVQVNEGACTRSFNRQVRVSNISLSAAITEPLCEGASNGALNMTVTEAIAPITYAWTGPNGSTASTEDLSGIPAGTYTVTVQDAACTRTQHFTVGQPQALSTTLAPTTLLFGQNIRCSGGADGAINATITGGTAPYSVNWSGPGGYGSSLTSISGLRAGAYAMSVTDAHGCTVNANTTLTDSPALSTSISGVTGVLCYAANNGSATVNVTGGTAPYTYSWNTTPAQNTATASGLAPGSYTVNVTDVYGCTISAGTTISGPTQALTTTLVSRTDVRCFGNSTGNATISASGGTAPYTYNWNTTPVQTTAAATNLSAGTWTVTVTDANGCSVQRAVTIAQPAQALAVSASVVSNVPCFGTNTGSASSSASGGTGPYAYQWNTSPVQNTANAIDLPVGTYTVTARDVNNCTATQPVTITGPSAALSASIPTHTDAACNGAQNGSATVNVSGGTAPYTYNWSTSPAQSTATAGNLGAGTYTVTITDSKGCSTTASTTIAQPAALAVTGTISPALCQGAGNGAIDASVSGGTAPYTYAWSGPGGFQASTQDVSGLVAGGYTLLVTDAHSCTATLSFDVNQPGLFNVSATLSDHHGVPVSCPTSTDGAVDITVSGATMPYTFTWTGPNGYSSILEDVTGLGIGSYSVTITDANGCSTGRTYDLSTSAPLSAQLTTSSHTGGTAIACANGSDGSITAALSGGIAPYGTSWSGPGGLTYAQQNISGLQAGTYTLTYTDANGCSAIQSTTLTAPAPIVMTPTGTVAQSCFGSANGQATVSVSGGTSPYTYNWNTLPAQHAATATGLIAGTYTVTVIDANGCSATRTITITGPSAALALSVTSTTNNVCFGGRTGAATVAASGGTSPYNYSWNTSPVTTSATATGLAAGSWTVQATDANGCTASRTVSITGPAAAVNAQALSVTGTSCFGAVDGGATLNITGGSGSYTVNWNTTPPMSGSTISGVASGIYTASITDNNGCPAVVTLPVTIGGPSSALSITSTAVTYAGGVNVSCPDASNGSIDATVMGGTAPYTYAWTDDFGHSWTTQDLTALAAGHYRLVTTDAHGCTASRNVTLNAPSAVLTSATIVSAICHGDNTGSVDLTATGGVPGLSYAWSGPNGFTANTQDIGHLYAGVYTVIVTDANGCTKSDLFDVTEPGTFNFGATLSAYTSGVNTRCATSQDGSIDMTPSGGTPPYSYQWTGPNAFTATTQDLVNIGAGTYHLVLLDANGCSALSTQTLVAPSAMTVQLDAQTFGGGHQVACANGSNGGIDATNGGGTPAYSYLWNGPNGFTAATAGISGLQAGTYTLTIGDANGCSINASATLNAPPALEAIIGGKDYPSGSGVSCVGMSDGTLRLSASGGRAPYTVVWTGPNGFVSTLWDISGLAPGTYNATVTDANGCSITRSGTITAPTPIDVTASIPLSNGHAVACSGGNTGSIHVTVTGGGGYYGYQWTGPNAFTATTPDLNGLTAGTYSLTVRDMNGCIATRDLTLTSPAAISVQGNVTTTACQGSSTGAVDITVSGGIAPYGYAWSALPAFIATTEDISNVMASVYTVVVTDANGCSNSTPFDVGQPGLFNISAEISSHTGGFGVSCAGGNDGSIDVTVTGGTPAYSYMWSGPNGLFSSMEDLSGLVPGEYTLSLTDANGCGGFARYTLTAPPALAVGLATATFPGGSNTGCNGSGDGSIDATITGGLAPYTLQWTGPNGGLGMDEDLNGLSAGTYTLDVTDAAGCSTSASITLNAPQSLSLGLQAAVKANGANTNCNGSADGSIDLSIAGGTAPFTILWNGPNGFIANTEDLNGLIQVPIP